MNQITSKNCGLNHWIIFCRIVDYFGDAGFCWRLSLALKNLGVRRITLVIDRLNILDDLRGSQRDPAVTARAWNVLEDEWNKNGVSAQDLADVVIEAFACNPPEIYLKALRDSTVWWTLDYLATEPWADSVQGSKSPSPRLKSPLASKRRWFVPGVSKATGGLLHGSWQHISSTRRKEWRKKLIAHSNQNLDLAKSSHSIKEAETFLVLAFGYADAPWTELEKLIAAKLPEGFKRVVLYQPRGIEYSQLEFDEILQACDLNFVRGEDSFVRAHWAAAGPWRTPFIWQPYRQAEEAHGHKLAGWLDQIALHPGLETFADLHWAFNHIKPSDYPKGLSLESAWRGFAEDFHAVCLRLQKACLELASRPSLEESLIAASQTNSSTF